MENKSCYEQAKYLLWDNFEAKLRALGTWEKVKEEAICNGGCQPWLDKVKALKKLFNRLEV
jgi:hypothetical protein